MICSVTSNQVFLPPPPQHDELGIHLGNLKLHLTSIEGSAKKKITTCALSLRSRQTQTRTICFCFYRACLITCVWQRQDVIELLTAGWRKHTVLTRRADWTDCAFKEKWSKRVTPTSDSLLPIISPPCFLSFPRFQGLDTAKGCFDTLMSDRLGGGGRLRRRGKKRVEKG